MHYKIYIPGVRGYSPEHLKRVGLGDLIDPGCPISGVDVLQNGPDQGNGVVFSWGDHPQPGYHRDAETWTACVARDPLPAGRFWIGRTGNSPPRPEELLRSNSLGGKPVTLSDGHTWLVPTVRILPSNYQLDDNGMPVRKVKPVYQAWVDRALTYFKMMLEWRENQGSDLTVPEAWTFAVESLTMNYRVNSALVSVFGLLDDISILAIIGSALEADQFEELDNLAQKKTAEFADLRLDS